MNGQADKLPKTLVGIAGEYLVAGELSRRGYIAAVTLRNTKGVDILASTGDASRSVGIQVKTAQGRRRIWPLSEKAEGYHSDNVFYIFVNLNDGAAPTYTIVPSQVVAQFAAEAHRSRRGTRHDGRALKDTTRRIFQDTERVYLDRWELLGLEEAPQEGRPTRWLRSA